MVFWPCLFLEKGLISMHGQSLPFRTHSLTLTINTMSNMILILCKTEIVKHMNWDVKLRIKRSHYCNSTWHAAVLYIYQRSQILNWSIANFFLSILCNFSEWISVLLLFFNWNYFGVGTIIQKTKQMQQEIKRRSHPSPPQSPKSPI